MNIFIEAKHIIHVSKCFLGNSLTLLTTNLLEILFRKLKVELLITFYVQFMHNFSIKNRIGLGFL
jgi:hypothetical protein